MRAVADLMVFGPPSARPEGVPLHRGSWESCPDGDAWWVATYDPGDHAMGKAGAACGQAALDMAGVQAESGGWKLEFTDVFDMHSNEMRKFVRQSIALQIGICEKS